MTTSEDAPLAERTYCLDPAIRSWEGNEALVTTLRWAFLREINLNVYDPYIEAGIIQDLACPRGISTPQDRAGTPHLHAVFQIYGLLLEEEDSDG